MRSIRLMPLALMVACSGARPESRAVPEWAVAAAPSLTIGAGEAEPGHELATVSGARMQHGIVVVANSGAHELQRFDSSGRYLGFEGRKGQGPGEFLGVLRLSIAPGDSLYVFDSDNLRWSVHDEHGRFAHNLPGGARAIPSAVWPYHRVIVRSPAGTPIPAWVLTVLDSIPEPRRGALPRQAVMDDLGFLWLQDSLSRRDWTIHGSTGPAIGHAVLPEGFALSQLGRDFVLGIAHDTSDQELIRIYPLARPDHLVLPAALPAGTIAPADSAARSSMLADMNGILTAQELFYSQHGSYTANADSLGGKVSSSAELVLLAGDKRHWVGMLYDRVTRTSCAMSVGFAPDGWLDGTPFCGR